jgi:malonyl-CoA O-methyltransferase
MRQAYYGFSGVSLSDARTSRIREAFGKAIAYDTHARPQAATARRLAELILAQGISTDARILDMGCGTGGLAAHLLASGKPGFYLCADISQAMLGRARAKLAGLAPCTQFACMDASAPALSPGFHLVASNMALHWVADTAKALNRLWELVLPGGLLAVAVPGEKTFASWREAHQRLGLACGLQDFFSVLSLENMFPGTASITEQTIELKLTRALDLPRHLKAVGGYVARSGHTPLDPGQFRAVLADLDTAGPSAGYHVLYALALKPSEE